MADMDARLAQLDNEWRRKYEALESARQRQVRDLSDTVHALVAILCDAIRIAVRDTATVEKMGRVVRSGLARLDAIGRAADAERDPDSRLN
jgi:hypothetical protein